ncbi:MAG: NAD-dependent epimerase/dehydratase family protein [Chloroflexi bacterium]|nr:GDP-mannose 4,6-dehydratase [Anaerolineaceae bacterium]NLI44894.1 NAD-dependent epimerase/dehydratase family protein [Chloroflexota bacterium]
MPVLVTGAGGFIGSRLVEALAGRGARVRAFVRYNSRGNVGLLKTLPPAVQDRVEIIMGDLRDEDALEKAADGAALVFHLGALISIPYSYQHPVEVVRTNILGTLAVLQACRRHGCRLIHTSTSEVYGTALRVPIDEQHPLQGQSPYSASKIGADKLVESYYRAFGVPAVTIRPFNTFGPGQSARSVIPTIITQALQAEEIHLGNLEARRDFTYLDDTVSAFIKAAEIPDLEGETFNLGSGSEVSVRELTEEIVALTNSRARVIVDEERLRPEKSEVLRLLADNSKARRVLGWSPQVSLREGLIKTIEWVRANMDFYRPGKYER